MTASCGCWVAPVALHDGHCCFKSYDADVNRVACGHDDEGMARFAEAEQIRNDRKAA